MITVTSDSDVCAIVSVQDGLVSEGIEGGGREYYPGDINIGGREYCLGDIGREGVLPGEY